MRWPWIRGPERLPVAPVNVRFVDQMTGEVHAVELAHLGRKRGVDYWRATALVGLRADRAYDLLADEVPGGCQIHVTVKRESSGE